MSQQTLINMTKKFDTSNLYTSDHRQRTREEKRSRKETRAGDFDSPKGKEPTLLTVCYPKWNHDSPVH